MRHKIIHNFVIYCSNSLKIRIRLKNTFISHTPSPLRSGFIWVLSNIIKFNRTVRTFPQFIYDWRRAIIAVRLIRILFRRIGSILQNICLIYKFALVFIKLRRKQHSYVFLFSKLPTWRYAHVLKGLCCSREDIGITKTLIIKVVFSYTHR